MKSEYIERRYKMNNNTTVIVRSKKSKDAEIYNNTITLTHSTADIKPLSIGTRDEIEAAINKIDLDDDQLALFGGGAPTERDDEDLQSVYAEAEALVKKEGKASTSLLQRRLKVGYGRAAVLIEMLENSGVIGKADGSKPRQVLVRA